LQRTVEHCANPEHSFSHQVRQLATAVFSSTVPILTSRVLKRIAKIFLITVAVLAVLLFVGVWILNRWLKSPELHARVERELSLALKLPLKFQTLSLSAFGGLRAEGVTVPDRGRNFFEATTFSAKNDFWSLLRGRIVFKEITVDAPKFVLRQRENGVWKLPDLPPDLQAELDARKSAKKSAEPKPAKTAEGTPKAKKSGEVLVGRIRITNGSAEFFEKDGKPYVSAFGIGATISNVREENVEGYAAIVRLVWHGEYAASDVGATVSYTTRGVIIDKFKGNMGGGSITGGFSNRLDQPGPPFNLKLHGDGVDIARAAAEADAPAPKLAGILTGSLSLKGIGDNKKSFTGNATFTLRDGFCREIEWVNQLGEIARQEDVDLSSFRIQELKGEFQIGGDRLLIKSLTAAAPPIGITAEGISRLDGTRLDLKAKFLAEANFLAKRPNIAPQFGPPDANQMRAVAFNLTGSLGKPKQNLMEKITGTTDRTDQRIKLGLDVFSGMKADREEQKKAAPAVREEP
jgi:type II secretion system protein N